MRSYILVFTLFLSFLAFPQDASEPSTTISILTVGPGSSLVDNFGHTGIRLKNGVNDYVFNYGIYDFDDPNFYTKFAQGRLLYKLGIQSFSAFTNSYKAQNRWVKEQVLQLTEAQKEAMVNYLLNNAKPENQYYKYDYFTNNCASKPYDIVKNTIKFSTAIDPELFEGNTYRSLIHDFAGSNTWGSFGIDIALGSLIDRPLTPEQHAFLPDYVYELFRTATTEDAVNLVENERVIVNADPVQIGFKMTSPLVIFLVLSLFILWMTYRDFKQQKRSAWLDGMLYIVTGLIGLVLFLLWFATDHIWTGYNYNMLWAFPLNVFIAFQAFKAKPSAWFKKYVKFLILLLCLMTLHWTIGIQRFSIALLPLLIALIVRYVVVIRLLK